MECVCNDMDYFIFHIKYVIIYINNINNYINNINKKLIINKLI